ncbi:MAG: hypothetical protein Q8K82_13765 [Gemmatimonadaceae bacterium]|nr:hypothetical protein [Gemmatimonadaceae bacterium]
MSCTIECTPHGMVIVDVDGIPLTRELDWLFSAASSDSACFELNVTNQTGATITSDDLLITSISTPLVDDRHLLKLSAQPGILDVRLTPLRPDALGMRSSVHYHTVGMQGFPGVKGTCDEGEVVVAAPTEVTDYHDVAGQIAFRREQDPTTMSDWIAACDERVITILRMMSFGLGRFVEWSVREVYRERTLLECRFVGPSRHGPPAEPPFHFLDLQPALDLALRNHRLLLDPRSGVGEAIDWLTPWHTFAEIRFLSAMTAFECLLARTGDLPSTLLTSSAFKRFVRPPLNDVLASDDLRGTLEADSAATDSVTVHDCLRELSAKLGNLNQRSLSTRLRAFLSRYDVPLDDLPIPIEVLARARHGVVHGTRLDRGETGAPDVTACAGAIREVLRRALLAMLGFEGRFTSYMREPQTVPFRGPPTLSSREDT